MRKPPELTPCLSSEDTERRQLSTSLEDSPYQGTEVACTLILDSPISRTMRNTCLLMKSPSLWYCRMAATPGRRLLQTKVSACDSGSLTASRLYSDCTSVLCLHHPGPPGTSPARSPCLSHEHLSNKFRAPYPGL